MPERRNHSPARETSGSKCQFSIGESRAFSWPSRKSMMRPWIRPRTRRKAAAPLMRPPLRAARRAAAGFGGGLHGADEGAHEFSVDFGGDGLHVDARLGEELAGVLDAVDAGGFDGDLVEAGGGQLGALFVLFERAGNAADPEQDALAVFGKHLAFGDDVGNDQPAAGLEDAEGFGQNAVFVGGEVNDAIGNDDIHRVGGQGNVLDLAFEELDVVDAGLAFVFVSESQHFIGHVEAVGFAAGRHAPGGEQDVDAAAASEIEDRFAGLQFGQRGGVAAAQRGQHGGLGELAFLFGVVEIAGDGIAAIQAGGGGSAAGTSAGGHTQSSLSVTLFNYFFDFHMRTPICKLAPASWAGWLWNGCSILRIKNSRAPGARRCWRCNGEKFLRAPPGPGLHSSVCRGDAKGWSWECRARSGSRRR